MKIEMSTSEELKNKEFDLEYYASLITEVILDMEAKKHPGCYYSRSDQPIRDLIEDSRDRGRRAK